MVIRNLRCITLLLKAIPDNAFLLEKRYHKFKLRVHVGERKLNRVSLGSPQQCSPSLDHYCQCTVVIDNNDISAGVGRMAVAKASSCLCLVLRISETSGS